MDIFDIHNVKVEKANALLRYHRFRSVAKLFRMTELFLAVILISWISTRLPSLFGTFHEYFQKLLIIIVSPLFIFLISNVIVITLVLKSSQLNGNSNAVSNAVSDLYDDIVHNNATDDVVIPVIDDVIAYQDKQIVSENKVSSVIKEIDDVITPVIMKDMKVYKRSQSENMMKRECVDDVSGKLKRSETEIGRRKEKIPVTKNIVDELSDKEFQKRIEGFIAKQVRFHQEEKLAIVVPSVVINNHD